MPSAAAGEASIDPLVVAAIKNAALKPFHNKLWISGRLGGLKTRTTPEHVVQVFGNSGNFLGSIKLAGLRRSSKGKIRQPFVYLHLQVDTVTHHWVLSRQSEEGRVLWWSDSQLEDPEFGRDAWDADFMQILRQAMASDGVRVSHLHNRNRLWQLKNALPLTLVHAYPFKDSCRVHVVDMGSTDGTLEWLLRYCRWAIEIGLLRVYRAEEKKWHACIGKNTAHIQAKEDILVNVDGDNLIGAGLDVAVIAGFYSSRFLEDVCKRFQDGCAVAQYELGGGTCGRIALRREDFLYIGGYDEDPGFLLAAVTRSLDSEDAHPMGAQDTDLVLRVKMLNKGHHKKVKEPLLSQAILNSQAKNSAIFNERRARGEIIRNQGQGWIGVPVKQWMFGSDGELKTMDKREKNLRVKRPPVASPADGASNTVVTIEGAWQRSNRAIAGVHVPGSRRSAVPEPTGEFFTAEFKTFNEANGWGFVGCEELRARFGADVFAHNRELVNVPNKAGASAVGEVIYFELGMTEDGKPQVLNAQPAGPVSSEPAAKKPRLEETPAASTESAEVVAAEEETLPPVVEETVPVEVEVLRRFLQQPKVSHSQAQAERLRSGDVHQCRDDEHGPPS
eukprot:s698_g5.t1